MKASQIMHRLELLIMSVVASAGMWLCKERHMFCGHLEHSSHYRMETWAYDSIWIFCLAGVAVVGMRGRFRESRAIGFVCALLILLMALIGTPLGHLGGVILGVLAFVQVMELADHLLRTNSDEQDAGSDGAAGGGSQLS